MQTNLHIISEDLGIQKPIYETLIINSYFNQIGSHKLSGPSHMWPRKHSSPHIPKGSFLPYLAFCLPTELHGDQMVLAIFHRNVLKAHTEVKSPGPQICILIF